MSRTHIRITATTAIALLALILLSLSRYEWNASALLRVDREFGEHFRVPPGIVLFEDGGYDGMLYYQIARDLPRLFAPRPPAGRAGSSPQASEAGYENAYRLQRILLPFFAFVLSHGSDDVLPFSILLINLAAVLGSLMLLLSIFRHETPEFPFHALALVFNPASLVGILFSLTEPLALFLTTAFLLLFLKNGQRLNAIQLTLLALAIFARETTIVLIVLLTLFFLLKKERRQALLVLIPLLPFVLFQLFLTLKLGVLPLAAGTGMFNLPLSGPWRLLVSSLTAPNAYMLSSLSFLLLFVLPLFCYLLYHYWQQRLIDTSEKLLSPRSNKNAHTEQGHWKTFPSRPDSKTRSCGVGKGDFSEVPKDSVGLVLIGLTAMLFLLDTHIWGALTSVGRVVPALYPVYALWAVEHDTLLTRSLSVALITISTVAAIGIALTSHPFTIS